MGIALLLAAALAGQTAGAADVNLVANPGLELVENGLPAGWTLMLEKKL